MGGLGETEGGWSKNPLLLFGWMLGLPGCCMLLRFGLFYCESHWPWLINGRTSYFGHPLSAKKLLISASSEFLGLYGPHEELTWLSKDLLVELLNGRSQGVVVSAEPGPLLPGCSGEWCQRCFCSIALEFLGI